MTRKNSIVLLFSVLLSALFPLALHAADGLSEVRAKGFCDGCDLSGVDISGEELHLHYIRNGRFTGTKLAAAVLVVDMDITRSDFTNANLTGATVTARVCQQSSFQGGSLWGATLTFSDAMSACTLRNTYAPWLRLEAPVREVVIIGSDLRRATLTFPPYGGAGGTLSVVQSDLREATVIVGQRAPVIQWTGGTRLDDALVGSKVCAAPSLNACL